MKHYLFIFVSLFLLALAACEPAPEESQQPTVITLQPFITETVRVTATLPPSETPTATATFTPSNTPTPVTPTATATATPTQPVLATVTAQQSARVRAEPNSNAEILTTITSGTAVEIHGASEGSEWILVRFIDVEGGGQTVDGWVQATLLAWEGDYIPPTQGPSPTPSPTFDPNMTPSPTPSGTAVTPSARLSTRNVRANCRQTDTAVPNIRANETVSVWWNWFVARPELMEDHLEHANYEILLDGVLLADYERFETALVREGRDWYVYWYYPVGTLAPGRHEVTYRLTWDEAVNDGYADFGPGTETEFEEGNCVFTVAE